MRILWPDRSLAFVKELLLRDGPILLAVLVAIEFSLQLFAPQYRDRVFDRERTGNHPIEANRFGMRGPELPYGPSQNGHRRILALGDSTTFGTGVATAATWPAQLGAVLSNETGPAEWINAGYPASYLRSNSLGFQQDWHRWESDVVVLAMSSNMVSFGWILRDEEATRSENEYAPLDTLSWPKRTNIIVRRWLHKLCLPSAIFENVERLMYWTGVTTHNVVPEAPYGPMLAFGWLQGDLPEERADEAWELVERDLAQLRDLVESRGARFYVTMIPARFALSNRAVDNEKVVPLDRLSIDPIDRVATICQKLSIPYVDARKAFQRTRTIEAEGTKVPALYIHYDSAHLDEHGHSALGAEIGLRILADEAGQRDRALTTTGG